MQKEILFISGLGGTGKSSLVWHFWEHPVPGFRFFDFDFGKYKIPPYGEDHLEWRTKMTKWWLAVGEAECSVQGNVPVIVGQSLFPRQILALDEAAPFAGHVGFGHLLCAPEERKVRLEARGDGHHWGGHKDWYDAFFAEMAAVGAREFDTTHRTIKEVAGEVVGWLKEQE